MDLLMTCRLLTRWGIRPHTSHNPGSVGEDPPSTPSSDTGYPE